MLRADAAGALGAFLLAARAVRGIREQDLGRGAVQQQRPILEVGAVAAHDAVVAEDPDIAALRDGLGRRLDLFLLVRLLVAGVVVLVLLGGAGDGLNDGVIFLGRAAGQLEVGAGVLDAGQNGRREAVVGLCELCDVVVGPEVGQLGRLGLVVLVVHGDRVEIFQLRSQ